jgi:hypothetical protein
MDSSKVLILPFSERHTVASFDLLTYNVNRFGKENKNETV